MKIPLHINNEDGINLDLKYNLHLRGMGLNPTGWPTAPGWSPRRVNPRRGSIEQLYGIAVGRAACLGVLAASRDGLITDREVSSRAQEKRRERVRHIERVRAQQLRGLEKSLVRRAAAGKPRDHSGGITL